MEHGYRRWWAYQRERFPLVAHGPLVAALAFSAVAFSAHLHEQPLPSAGPIAVAFLVTLSFFALLRIADEHKDLEDDSRYRPYRPVPRGLVSLAELRRIAFALMTLQAALSLALSPWLLVPLVATWGYLGLMTAEFFVRDWLKAHPLVYLVSHMVVMGLIVLYATACEWLPRVTAPDARLGCFLGMSFFGGVVVEVGRKLRAPEDEEAGVETYTALFGPARASAGFIAAMALSGACAVLAASVVEAGTLTALVLGAVLIAAAVSARDFVKAPTSSRSRRLEVLSGVWVLAAYLTLAVVPMVTR